MNLAALGVSFAVAAIYCLHKWRQERNRPYTAAEWLRQMKRRNLGVR